MAKLKKRKPLQKYQTGGSTNDPWGFQGSGLLNPFNYDITKGFTGTGTLDVMKPGQNTINFGDNPFGQQIGESAVKTAGMFQGLFPTTQVEKITVGNPFGEKLFGGAFNKLFPGSQKAPPEFRDRVIKQKKLVKVGKKWKNSAGEEYSEKELDELAEISLGEENQRRERNKELAPLATPLTMLNELGEAQKTSYNQAQKESMYDVTKSPLSMESKGFFAKEGMRTPPVTEVYRMMGAHQGLPETSYKLAKTLNFKTAQNKELNDLLEQVVMEEGGNVTSAINEIENLQNIQNNMYNNNQRISRLAMMLGGGMEGAPQEQQPQTGENKYLQLPPEQQVEVYKQIIDFVMQNGIDALEQQYPEEYQFFEEFGDMLEGEEEDMGGEGEGEMETEEDRMEMRGGEEQEMEQEYPTDEQEVPVGARPGENAMRPAQPMPGAEQMKEGGIPQRYRNMGFTKVGQKRQSDRPGKKWAVLAKKGNQYKVVHGGAKGMEDFKQHGSKERQKRFWDRMGGKDSAKAKDPFSPLYWAAKGFTNAGPTW